jgi:hypothetical protein
MLGYLQNPHKFRDLPARASMAKHAKQPYVGSIGNANNIGSKFGNPIDVLRS